MKIAWSPTKDIEFNHLEDNLFTIKCFCLGDWLKVEKGGPWLFRQSVVSIEPYDGLALPETVDLNFFTTWIQIHKIPVGYRKQESLIKNLTEKKVGKVLETQLDVKGAGNFVRVRVRFDVRKPLARFVSISREGAREIYPIKYEKMPRFCGACGCIGHIHLECGTGEYDETKLKWGDFLKADWDSWVGRAVGSRGGFSGRGADRVNRGRMGGRGRDAGRGNAQSWRHNALEFVDGHAIVECIQNPNIEREQSEEHETDDTASSPGKKDMDVDKQNLVNSAAKRTLELGKEGMAEHTDENGLSTAAEAMATDGSLLNGPTNVEGDKVRAKRTKKDGANSSSLGSAESLEGSVRS
jgi:hypothetical protein